jgi:hypothetical protein
LPSSMRVVKECGWISITRRKSASAFTGSGEFW